MPKICYVDKKFSASSEAVIENANAIIAEYQAEGYTLTLRQLYYQFVSRDLSPNTMKDYKRIGSIINDGRLAGLIDWEAIEDRTRNLEKLGTWDSPQEILDATAKQFRFDWWEDQPYRVEVWVEKEALVGVIERAAFKWRMPYFACRGYTSQSEAWVAGQRFIEYAEAGQSVLILHLGDHDPSGIDMTRDNQDRITTFMSENNAGFDNLAVVERIALNMDQVRRYRPPPNPAKFTDSRAADYVRKFGKSSWELDALDPKVIDQLITDAVQGVLDYDKWEAQKAREEKARAKIATMAKNWKD